MALKVLIKTMIIQILISLFLPLIACANTSFIAKRTTHMHSHHREPRTISYPIWQEHNGDDYLRLGAGSFTKSLEHNSQTGLLTANGFTQYQKLLNALHTGNQRDFNAIKRFSESSLLFSNPQAAYARNFQGPASDTIAVPSSPQLESEYAAADMIEVYLKAICRDVAFHDYGTGLGTDIDTLNGGSKTNNAALILSSLHPRYKCPREAGKVTPNVLFRGNTQGNRVGPYISQFFYLAPKDSHIKNPYFIRKKNSREFGVSWDDFVALQNGAIPRPYTNTDFTGFRYITTGRDLAQVVNDDAWPLFLHIINVLASYQIPFNNACPYQNNVMKNESPYVTFGIADIVSAVVNVTQLALKHAWAHKWLGSRRLRPEAMAGLVHQAKITGTNPYNLHTSLFQKLAGIDLLAWVNAYNKEQAKIPDNITLEQSNTYLLSQVYPEGSPTHPSYPSAHAVVAGACTTVIKAFFNCDRKISDFTDPVRPHPQDPSKLIPLSPEEGAYKLTINGELEKIADNCGLGRNIAGVHFRSDSDAGIELGEKVALKFLQDQAKIYHEQGFKGFRLRLRNGQKVFITPSEIINI